MTATSRCTSPCKWCYTTMRPIAPPSQVNVIRPPRLKLDSIRVGLDTVMMPLSNQYTINTKQHNNKKCDIVEVIIGSTYFAHTGSSCSLRHCRPRVNAINFTLPYRLHILGNLTSTNFLLNNFVDSYRYYKGIAHLLRLTLRNRVRRRKRTITL